MHFIVFKFKEQHLYSYFEVFSTATMSKIFLLGTIQVLRQQRSGWVGSENGNLIYNTIYADVGGWVT